MLIFNISYCIGKKNYNIRYLLIIYAYIIFMWKFTVYLYNYHRFALIDDYNLYELIITSYNNKITKCLKVLSRDPLLKI